MSLVRAGIALSKAEERLRDAVAQYEKDLNLDQQKTLLAYRLQAHNSPPDVSDVMRITAEIDREVSKTKVFRGRCFGPRFTNILQAVQQFAALGDVIVGGSQNLIACGVWSLLTANFSACVERLSKLLMDAGRAAPRYQEMALLYPQSRSLRSNMCEYFTVVVRLCHQLVMFTKQSIFQQLKAFLSDQEMTSFRDQLDHWAVSIKAEVWLLTNKSIEEQGMSLKAIMRSGKTRRAEKAKFKVLNYCSTYDYQSTWKELRKAGNTSLLQGSAEYHSWKTARQSATLICQGKLGSGKSVLLANMVADLGLHVGSAKCSIVYFFCRHNIDESLKAQTIIGSIVRQLLTRVADFTEIERQIVEDYSPRSSLAVDEGYRMLQDCFPAGLEAFIILDGLDECTEKEKATVYDQLQTLQKRFTLRICLSDRLELDTFFPARAAQLLNLHRLSVRNNAADIANFIDDELERLIKSNRLRLTDPTLVLEIADALLEGAQGMFLWVALQISDLCQQENQTDADIRRALKNLPKDLNETFSRILRNATENSKGYQNQVLKVLTTVYRPLTAEELREALSIVPGNRVWNSEELISDIYAVLASCGSLVMVDEESLTIRIVHQSVVQFLFGEYKGAARPIITREGAEKAVGEIVITYLSYDVFDSSISVRVAPEIPAAPANIIRTMDIPLSVRDTAVKLLQLRKQPGFDMGQVLFATSQQSSTYVEKWPFYGYAKEHWERHSRYIETNNLEMMRLLISVAHKQVILEENDTLVRWAIRHKHNPVAQAATDERKFTESLMQSIVHGDSDSAMKLVGEIPWRYEEFNYQLWAIAAKRPFFCSGQLLNNMLRQAVILEKFKGPEVLGRLLKTGIRLDNIALLRLLEEHKYDLLSLILKENIDVECRSVEGGQTLLYWASCGLSHGIVQMLLQAGANVNSVETIHGETPLIGATRHQRLSTVELLATHGAELDARDRHGDTALTKAAALWDSDIVEVLLRQGADPNVKHPWGMTALNRALSKVRSEEDSKLAACVDALITWGADIHHDLVDGITCLAFARKLGYEKTVEVLLEAERTLQIKGYVPLHYAAKGGHAKTVEHILVTGADPNIRAKSGKTALIYAVEADNESVIDVLLAHGADPSIPKNCGETALMIAARAGNASVCKRLVTKEGSPTNSAFEFQSQLSLEVAQSPLPEMAHPIERGAMVKPLFFKASDATDKHATRFPSYILVYNQDDEIVEVVSPHKT